ncbi:MAG: S24 family peptidase [Gordonibacter sp.]|uniref:LexA family protein n=2 Tax=Gordonibacter sp. TaxID=1968902 RepID=UPI002FC6A7A3
MGKLEDQIRDRIELIYGSIPKFSDEVGIPAQTIYGLLKRGINAGTASTVLPVIAKLGYDLNWIVKNRLIDAGNDSSDFVDVPLYGSIAAGTPIEMVEVENTHPVPTKVHDMHPEAFLLKIEGESMNHILPNGCYALIDPSNEVEKDNDPYAVCVNGYAATIKRVKKLANGFQLVPDSTDPTYPVQTFNYNEPDTETITVIGRVVYYVLPYDWSF